MTKSQAIKKKCAECSGHSPKEVTLCHIVDCPIWEFRFGYSMRDRRFRERMASAKKNYPEEYQEMATLVSECLSILEISPKTTQIRTLFEDIP